MICTNLNSRRVKGHWQLLLLSAWMPEWDVFGTIKFDSDSQKKKIKKIIIGRVEQLVKIPRGRALKKCTLPVLQRQLRYVSRFLNASIVNNVSGMSGFCSLCISIFPAHFFNCRPNCVPRYSGLAAFCGNAKFTDAAGFTCVRTGADVTSLNLKNSPRAHACNTRVEIL